MCAPRLLEKTICIASAIFCLPLELPANAQERPGAVAEVAAGTFSFPDDGVVTENIVGSAGRYYVLPRISVGPEIAYVHGHNHDHLMVTVNATVDFIRPAPQPGRVIPFVVVGAGLFRTHETLPNAPSFSSIEGAFTAGGGVRTHIRNRIFLGVEARVGWESHVRLNGLAGVRFGA